MECTNLVVWKLYDIQKQICSSFFIYQWKNAVDVTVCPRNSVLYSFGRLLFCIKQELQLKTGRYQLMDEIAHVRWELRSSGMWCWKAEDEGTTVSGVTDIFVPLCKMSPVTSESYMAIFNPLNPELNPVCHLLALLGAHPILHISRIRVNAVVINRKKLFTYILFRVWVLANTWEFAQIVGAID